MVKNVGFIGEGDCEVILLKSEMFNNYLQTHNLKSIGVFNACGNGQFQKDNYTMRSFFHECEPQNAVKVLVLMDIENEPCVTSLINKYHNFSSKQINIVSKKALESWYLSDSATLSKIFNTNFHYEDPENTEEMPYKIMRDLFKQYNASGYRTKVILTNKMLENGFDIENCLNHPNISSLKYFDRILKSI